MTIRIPPSLKWLVEKRATIAGKINLQAKTFDAEKSELAAMQEKLASKREKALSALKRDLAAIDRSILLHEILVNPKLIEATRIQSQPCTTHYGAITKAIYGALAMAAPNAATTADVTKYVISKCGFDDSAEKYQAMRRKIQHRLKDMVKHGTVCRLHSGQGGEHGVWCDPASFEALQRQRSQFAAYFLGNNPQTIEKSRLS